jgi:hypothetical protein
MHSNFLLSVSLFIVRWGTMSSALHHRPAVWMIFHVDGELQGRIVSRISRLSAQSFSLIQGQQRVLFAHHRPMNRRHPCEFRSRLFVAQSEHAGCITTPQLLRRGAIASSSGIREILTLSKVSERQWVEGFFTKHPLRDVGNSLNE